MPILWRSFIFQFLKIMLFCSCAFVAILLTIRLDEIAHFIALGAPIATVGWFTLYQIPYILPIAIPISCLISALIFMQRLSGTHELTALRASGLGLKDIVVPILLTACLFSLFNFWIVSEVATHSHLTTNQLKSQLRSINPLLLLGNKHLRRLKGIFFETLGSSKIGESASQVILAVPNKSKQRIVLLTAQQFRSTPSHFSTDQSTLISSLDPNKNNDGFDQIIVENMEKSESTLQDFSTLFRDKINTINNDHLQMSFLLARIQHTRELISEAKMNGNSERLKELKIELGRSLADIARRFSIAIGVICFSLVGLAFGIHIGRERKKSRLFWVIGLTTLYLVCFFTAKGLGKNWELATILYLTPTLILTLVSLYFLHRTSRGIE